MIPTVSSTHWSGAPELALVSTHGRCYIHLYSNSYHCQFSAKCDACEERMFGSWNSNYNDLHIIGIRKQKAPCVCTGLERTRAHSISKNYSLCAGHAHRMHMHRFGLATPLDFLSSARWWVYAFDNDKFSVVFWLLGAVTQAHSKPFDDEQDSSVQCSLVTSASIQPWSTPLGAHYNPEFGCFKRKICCSVCWRMEVVTIKTNSVPASDSFGTGHPKRGIKKT